MKHKFNKRKKDYTLKRGEFLYIPSNLINHLPEYTVSTLRSSGYVYIKINGKIEKIPCGLNVSIKKSGEAFKMETTLFLDATEDEVRFDIDWKASHVWNHK